MNKLIILLFVLSGCKSSQEIEYEQYLIAGKNIYDQQCSNCHGIQGEGLKNLYPPLQNSDFLVHKSLVVCIIKNGFSGPMMVNGKEYNQAMPAQAKLYDLDIAQLTTWLYHTYGEDQWFVKPDSVKKILQKCE